MINTVNDEIKKTLFELLVAKQFLAMGFTQHSLILAGLSLGLPTCQRIHANSQTLVIR